MWVDKVGFIKVNGYYKLAKRRTCLLIKTYIIQYIFYNYPKEYENLTSDDYKNIWDSAIDALEKVGYLSISDLYELIDNKLGHSQYHFWFDEL